MDKPYYQFFLQTLRKHFPDCYPRIMTAIDHRFADVSPDVAFAADSSNPIDRRLDFTAYFLSTILTLEGEGQSYEQIKSVCMEIVLDYVQPRNSLHAWFKKIPAKLVSSFWVKPILFKFNRRVNTLGHPDGFKAVILTDKAETHGLGYGVDILECGICKLFHKNGAQKYSPILCEVDKVTSGLAGLDLIRTNTIANGGAKCDFRWKRSKS